MITRLIPLALASSLLALPAFAQEGDTDATEPTVEASQAVEAEAEADIVADTETDTGEDSIVVEESEASTTLEGLQEDETMPDAAQPGLGTAYDAVTTGGVGADGQTVSADASEGRSLETGTTAGERGAAASATGAGNAGGGAGGAGGSAGGGAGGAGGGRP
ncbi:hypothetical protein [Halomonas sp. M4R1S46]|uniref:hypothetical protein n=1 Tax=Halomonas sp. M4R1S46 TaxID=2982692 RepID=UPI0021E41857|nr:hypothetical protein [Halomonas sp. M4R1S46]UYG08822.1 hypothetical protein OCT48_05690 [Halomonas sp. M4R1S46]